MRVPAIWCKDTSHRQSSCYIYSHHISFSNLLFSVLFPLSSFPSRQSTKPPPTISFVGTDKNEDHVFSGVQLLQLQLSNHGKRIPACLGEIHAPRTGFRLVVRRNVSTELIHFHIRPWISVSNNLIICTTQPIAHDPRHALEGRVHTIPLTATICGLEERFLGGQDEAKLDGGTFSTKEGETITGPAEEGRVWRPFSGESSASPTTSYFRGRDRNRIFTSQSSVIHSHGIQNKSIPSMARRRWRGVCSSFLSHRWKDFTLSGSSRPRVMMNAKVRALASVPGITCPTSTGRQAVG